MEQSNRADKADWSRLKDIIKEGIAVCVEYTEKEGQRSEYADMLVFIFSRILDTAFQNLVGRWKA